VDARTECKSACSTTTPAGGGLHLTTTYEVDALGRVTRKVHPNGRVDYFTYPSTPTSSATNPGPSPSGHIMRAPLSKHGPLLPGMVVWRSVKVVSYFPLEERHVKPPPKSPVIWGQARPIRLSEFEGGPWWTRNSNRVIGRQSADGMVGWRDDFLGHPRFGAGPHVNVWGQAKSSFICSTKSSTVGTPLAQEDDRCSLH
jgi:hypothetical protein